MKFTSKKSVDELILEKKEELMIEKLKGIVSAKNTNTKENQLKINQVNLRLSNLLTN